MQSTQWQHPAKVQYHWHIRNAWQVVPLAPLTSTPQAISEATDYSTAPVMTWLA